MSVGLPKWMGMARALRKEFDVHSVFTWEKFIRQGIDAHIFGRAKGLDDLYSYTPISVYFKQLIMRPNTDGEFKCPSDLLSVSAYSYNKWKYGSAEFHTKLPTVAVASQEIFMGLKTGAYGGGGVAAFHLESTDKLYVSVGAWGVTKNLVEITDALPANYKTARHTYRVKMNKSHAEFYIDTTLVAIVVFSPYLAFTKIEYPPYAIAGISSFPNPHMLAHVEVEGYGTELILPLAPSNMRLTDGEPTPSRVFRLYDAGTTDLFAGLEITEGSETSHPFPIFGYTTKTIHFKADKASTADGLVIEFLTQTNNWRTYDAVTYEANDDWFYTITGEGVLARLKYTPSGYTATIAEGEVAMR